MEETLKELKRRIENIEEALKNKAGVALVTAYTEPLKADVRALEKTLALLAELATKGVEGTNPSVAQMIRQHFSGASRG